MTSSVPPAVGVDGYLGGWIAAAADAGRGVTWLATAHIVDILDRWPRSVICVDMPIGLPDAGERQVDAAARDWLRDHGGPRQSIFMCPTRHVLADRHRSHAEAMVRARGRGEKGTSIQMWNLLPKVAELAAAIGERPASTVLEAHPECSFRALDERVRDSKKTPRGVGQRGQALQRWADPVRALAEVPDGPAVDDALDALVLSWTAARVAAGTEIRLGVGTSTMAI